MTLVPVFIASLRVVHLDCRRVCSNDIVHGHNAPARKYANDRVNRTQDASPLPPYTHFLHGGGGKLLRAIA